LGFGHGDAFLIRDYGIFLVKFSKKCHFVKKGAFGVNRGGFFPKSGRKWTENGYSVGREGIFGTESAKSVNRSGAFGS
jgi:hypothetical protein